MEKAKIENAKEKIYIAIDLKSFYASVECIERGRDALTTNLVVADASRTEKTICLAVSPSLKEYGIPGRARLFEVVAKVKQVNAQRRNAIKEHSFTGSSDDSIALKKNKTLCTRLYCCKTTDGIIYAIQHPDLSDLSEIYL